MTIKVLVLDRHGHVREMLKEALAPLEVQVIPASSTALAIFLTRKNFPSLIVLNLLTVEDEGELPLEIANDPELSHIPVVVFVSAEFESSSLVVSDSTKVLIIPNSLQVMRSQLVPFLRVLVDDREHETTE